MKSVLLASAIAAATLAFGGTAAAQSNTPGDYATNAAQRPKDINTKMYEYQVWLHNRQVLMAQGSDPAGAGPNPLNEGVQQQALPEYRVDWWQYGLPRPPRQYDWYRMGNDYALVSRINGAIAQVLHGR